MSLPGRGIRIAYLTSQYARAGDTFIRAEVAALREMGFEIHTFSIRAPEGGEFIANEQIRREREATEDILAKGIGRLILAALRLGVTRPGRFAKTLALALRISAPGFRGPLWSIAYFLEACFLARRMEAKGVRHLHNHLGANSATVAMLASELSGIPYSLTIHGPTEFEMAQQLALDVKIARAAFTIAISAYCRSQLTRISAEADWPRMHVVRCGVCEQFRTATPTPVPNVPRLICVARFIELKGHGLLIEAIDRLVKGGIDVELDLVGDGALRASIEKRIREHGLESRIRLEGWQDSDEVRERIESSRALVLPSFAEGLPVSVMEAMALARPVIVTNVGAISELVDSGVHGWVIPPGSVDALCDAIRQAMQTPVARLSEMGQHGRERVLQLHDARREAQKLAPLMAQSASRR